MRITIEDLEALKELNDELEENHMENEKQLQTEIGVYISIEYLNADTRNHLADIILFCYIRKDQKDTQIRDYLRRLGSADETNADYEATISQFRELVANLQRSLE